MHIITRNSNAEHSATDEPRRGIKHHIQGSELPPNSYQQPGETVFLKKHSPRFLAMPTISGHLMKYQLATEPMAQPTHTSREATE